MLLRIASSFASSSNLVYYCCSVLAHCSVQFAVGFDLSLISGTLFCFYIVLKNAQVADNYNKSQEVYCRCRCYYFVDFAIFSGVAFLVLS